MSVQTTFFNLIRSFVIICLLKPTLSAQQISLEDYKRALSFTYDALNNKQVYNLYMKQGFFRDHTGLWQVNHSREGKQFEVVWFDSEEEKKALFDHQQVADNLQKLVESDVDQSNLPFSAIDKKKDSLIWVTVQGAKYQIDLRTNKVSKDESDKVAKADPKKSYSGDSSWVAYTEDYNLFVKDRKSDKTFQLSSEGEKNFEFGSYYGWYDLMKGENGERPNNFNVDWSADSKWLRTNICDLRSARKMYLLDWSVDTLYRPELYAYYRGSPGDTTMVYEIPVFYNLQTKKEIKPRLASRTHINSYRVKWIEGENKVLIIDAERGYKKLNFYVLDLVSEELKLLFSETSETRVGNKLEIELFPKEKTFVFTSERSGWNHLYAHNFETGKTKPLTKGDYVINKIVKIDTVANQIYFLASGRNEWMNPYHQQLHRIGLNGKSLKNLTPEATHHEIKFSPDGKFFTDKISSIVKPAAYTLRDVATGEILLRLGQTDVSALAKKNWEAPMPFEAVGRDGETAIFGALWKPTNFNPNKTYPIIDNTYTGPHTQVFPKTYAHAFWGLQALAELGFIVMNVDGMGTNGRSKDFQDVSYKNMGNNLLDHIGAIRQLSQKYSWIDTTRVGIYGHSAGGFDTGRALLAFPDFYKVGVASSADHDFRMEKAWWPEMYMGWPVDSSYHEVSNITMAPNLKGKLLIVHGGMDENVNPSASFKLAEALIKANKDFDMLIMPSQHHGYNGVHKDYFNKKRWNYFVEHLLGAEPIWDIEKK